VLRPYEKPLLAAIVILCAALVVLAPGAFGQRGPEKNLGLGAYAGGCDTEGAVLRVVDPASRVALAADEAGRPELYGGADPGSGGPTEDHYEILRACSPRSAPHLTVLVEGSEPTPAGDAVVEAPTRLAPGGVLVTRYGFPGGVFVEQRLSLKGEDLRLSYRLENRSDKRRAVSVRALLTPPPQPGREAEACWTPAPCAFADEIRLEQNVPADEIRPFYVPRKGVPSDSSGRWSPGTGARASRPDLLTFAGTWELGSAPFGYDPKDTWPMPDAVSFAVYWLDEDLAPGETVELSHLYDTLPFDGEDR
jgi:hypothetical protein